LRRELEELKLRLKFAINPRTVLMIGYWDVERVITSDPCGDSAGERDAGRFIIEQEEDHYRITTSQQLIPDCRPTKGNAHYIRSGDTLTYEYTCSGAVLDGCSFMVRGTGTYTFTSNNSFMGTTHTVIFDVEGNCDGITAEGCSTQRWVTGSRCSDCVEACTGPAAP
jgi:hypothetical protein